MPKYILSIIILLSSVLLSFTSIQTSAATATYQSERQNCSTLRGLEYSQCVKDWKQNYTSISNPVNVKPATNSSKAQHTCEIVNGQTLCNSVIPDCTIYRNGCDTVYKTTRNYQDPLPPARNTCSKGTTGIYPNCKTSKKEVKKVNTSNPKEFYVVNDKYLKTQLGGNTLIYGDDKFVKCSFGESKLTCAYYSEFSTIYYSAKISGNAVYINKYNDIEKSYLNNFNPTKPTAVNKKYNKRQYLIPVSPESLPINFFNQK